MIPKSTVREEYESNFNSGDFALSEKDMVRLSMLDTKTRCFDYSLDAEHGNLPVFH